MVDEKVAAHQLVDEKLFYQGGSAVLGEHASGWSFERDGGERFDTLALLSLNHFANIWASELFVLFENLRCWNMVGSSLRRSSGTLLVCLMILEN